MRQTAVQIGMPLVTIPLSCHALMRPTDTAVQINMALSYHAPIRQTGTAVQINMN